MIVVLVPELEALLREAGQAPGRVGHILARGRCRRLDISHYQSELLTGQALPPAPLTRLFDQPQDADGAWIRADPVKLVPDLNAVWMQPGAELAPASVAAGELTALFADNGLQFDLPAPGRGYLRLQQAPACRFIPPWAVSGQSLDHVLPVGADARPWRKLLNEAQMLLHQHLDNDRNGATQPGGLWFWGAGKLPLRETVSTRVSSVCGSDPVLIALARWLAMAGHAMNGDQLPPASSLSEWQVKPELGAEQNLAALDDWLKPLWRRLRSGRLRVLELASRERAWTLNPGAAWCFWRRADSGPG
ncbi:MAG: hypothetical protein ACNA7J_13125 [Wenzhouxiangella sp.]